MPGLRPLVLLLALCALCPSAGIPVSSCVAQARCLHLTIIATDTNCGDEAAAYKACLKWVPGDSCVKTPTPPANETISHMCTKDPTRCVPDGEDTFGLNKGVVVRHWTAGEEHCQVGPAGSRLFFLINDDPNGECAGPYGNHELVGGMSASCTARSLMGPEVESCVNGPAESDCVWQIQLPDAASKRVMAVQATPNGARDTGTPTLTTTSTGTSTVSATGTTSGTTTSTRTGTTTGTSTLTTSTTNTASATIATDGEARLTRTTSKDTTPGGPCPTVLYPNSHQNSIGGPAGTIAWVTCNNGYIGGGVNFCQSNGTWLRVLEQCTEIEEARCTIVTIQFATDSLGPEVGFEVNGTNVSMPVGSIAANTAFDVTVCVTKGKDVLRLYGTPVSNRKGFAPLKVNNSRCLPEETTDGTLYKLLSCRGEYVVRDTDVARSNETVASPTTTGLPTWALVTIAIVAGVAIPLVGVAVFLKWWCQRPPKEISMDALMSPHVKDFTRPQLRHKAFMLPTPPNNFRTAPDSRVICCSPVHQFRTTRRTTLDVESQ